MIKLYVKAARRPPRSEPQNNLDFRSGAMPRKPLSAALFERQTRPSSRKRVKFAPAERESERVLEHSLTFDVAADIAGIDRRAACVSTAGQHRHRRIIGMQALESIMYMRKQLYASAACGRLLAHRN